MKRTREKIMWVLSELYYPEDSATGHNVTKVAEGLAERYNVRALCAQPTYQSRGTKAPKDEEHNNVLIHRCGATTLNKDVLFFRLLNILTISCSIFLNALFRIRRGDVVLVVTNPPTLPFVVYLACSLRRATLILRVEDVYPDAILAAGMSGEHSLFVKMLNSLQSGLYKRVDRIIVLGRDMMNLVRPRAGDNSGRITLITNFADSDQIWPLSRQENPLLQRYGLIDKFVVQYSGNMGRTHGIESLVYSARLLSAESSVHFLFIGFGAKVAWLRKAVEEFQLKNITVLPMQPRNELVSSLNACDLAAVSFVPGMAGVSVPCRMYNIMSAGKPILAVSDIDSELSMVVDEERIGWVVQPEKPELIAGAIREAVSNRRLLSEMSARARALATEKYSLAYVVDRYKIMMAEVASSCTSARVVRK